MIAREPELQRNSFAPVPTLLHELTADGLILWRLRWTANHQMWCVVEDSADNLALTVYEQGSNRVPVFEVHETITSVVSRANALRDQAVAAGWEVVDVDLDEQD